MPPRSVVVIGASAGGLEALAAITKRLHPPFPAALLVVIHTSTNSSGDLPRVLARHAFLPVSFARDGDAIEAGRIYIAPPDYHLIVDPDGLRVVHGPRENGFRPAVDPLFRTAARTLGRQVIGVILSGALDDGTYGLSIVKHSGGMAVVQDPADAVVSSMPRSALSHVDVDFVAAASEIPAILLRLVTSNPEVSEMPPKKEPEPQLLENGTEVGTMQRTYGPPSALTCPECGGALWEIRENGVTRYQCHTGHQFAPDSLQAEQRDAIDGALWTAVRVLEEHAELKDRMARQAAGQGLDTVARGFEAGAREAHSQAQQIRAVLFAADNSGGIAPPPEVQGLGITADLPRRRRTAKGEPRASRKKTVARKGGRKKRRR